MRKEGSKYGSDKHPNEALRGPRDEAIEWHHAGVVCPRVGLDA